MGALPNPKQEKFARCLATGMSQYDAHEAAGYKPNPGNASLLANRPAVKKRLLELTTAARANHELEIISNGGSRPRLINPDDPSSLTIANLQKEMLINMYTARDRGQVTAANKALEMVARTLGAFGMGDESPLQGNGKNKSDADTNPTVQVEKLHIAFEQFDKHTGRIDQEAKTIIDGNAEVVDGFDEHSGSTEPTESSE